MFHNVEKHQVFVTAAMAEILITQNLIPDARRVVDQLRRQEGKTPRVLALLKRLAEIGRPSEPSPREPLGNDSILIEMVDRHLRLAWELTEESLAVAQRKARYSGKVVLRLFSAVPGPRGVRTATRDIPIEPLSAELSLPGLPQPAVHVAAVGFLANTGEFVPVARSELLPVVP